MPQFNKVVTELGRVIKNRGEWTSLASDAKLYTDNVVQYNHSAYIVKNADSGITKDATPNVDTTHYEIFAGVGTIDETPTPGSHNVVESGGVAEELAMGAVYDVTAHNDGAKFDSLAALLSDAGINTLIPTSKRKGGMSIKFVLNSDNKYLQFRYMLPYAGNTTAENNKFVTPTNWQGVDDEPTAGSENLVESGGVYSLLKREVGQFYNVDLTDLHNGYIRKVANILSWYSGELTKHIVIPCVAGDIFEIKANEDRQSTYTFLKSYDMSVDPDLCTGETLENLDAGTTTTLTAPVDAHYLYITIKPDTLVDKTPQYVKVLSSRFEAIDDTINDIEDSINDIEDSINTNLTTYVPLSLTSLQNGYIQFNANIYSWYGVDGDVCKHIVIPCVAGDNFIIKANEDRYTTYTFLKSYNLSTAPDLCLGETLHNITANTEINTTAPVDAQYLYITIREQIPSIRMPQYVKLLSSRLNYMDEEISNINENINGIVKTPTLIEHLSNPFVKTTIHLFGDSITQGVGSSDYSDTGDIIPHTSNIRRNTGHKSYAALFASQINRLFNREIWISFDNNNFILNQNGYISMQGDYQTGDEYTSGNVQDRIYVQFEFVGTTFTVKNATYSYGSIYKIIVDDVEKATVDTYGSGGYIDTTISELEDTLHTVKFVGTGQTSGLSTKVLYFSALKLTKLVDVINDGISGHKSPATNNLVRTNTTIEDDFVIWMSGTNDRVEGYWLTRNSVLSLYYWMKNNRPNTQLILMSANPCGTTEFNSDIYKSNMDEINMVICDEARKYNIMFISHYEYLTRYCREKEIGINSISTDHVHPNDLGHMLIYQNLCKELGISVDSNF